METQVHMDPLHLGDVWLGVDLRTDIKNTCV